MAVNGKCTYTSQACMQDTTNGTHKDNITSLRTGVLCVPYSVESAVIGPPALKEEGTS